MLASEVRNSTYVHFDQLLPAVHNPPLSVFRDGNIASSHPAKATHGLLGSLFVLPIAKHHLRTSQTQLSPLAFLGNLVLVFVQKKSLCAGQQVDHIGVGQLCGAFTCVRHEVSDTT